MRCVVLPVSAECFDEQCNKARLAHRKLIPLIQVSPADSENDHDYDPGDLKI